MAKKNIVSLFITDTLNSLKRYRAQVAKYSINIVSYVFLFLFYNCFNLRL